MAITFDQLLETIIQDPLTGKRLRDREAGFERIQGNAHLLSALFSEWKTNQLTNNQIIIIINLDDTDLELTMVKTRLNSLSKAQTLALQDIMILAGEGIDGYDKTRLRTVFGL